MLLLANPGPKLSICSVVNDVVVVLVVVVVVVVRRAIWERHGNAIGWIVRVIGDFRAGLQTSSCSHCSAHRPATHDDIVDQIAAV